MPYFAGEEVSGGVVVFDHPGNISPSEEALVRVSAWPWPETEEVAVMTSYAHLVPEEEADALRHGWGVAAHDFDVNVYTLA